MKRTAWLVLFLSALSQGAQAPPPPPKLVVALVVDQYRYDYLTRFKTDYHGGFNRLLAEGAVFTNAFLDHFPTFTAVGHSTFLTGATPSLSGIVGNDWYDRESGKIVTSVSDDTVELLGGKPGKGSSPRRLQVSTIGDEMKMSGKWATRVIGISIKDRSAILSAGHMADGAFWFDSTTGNFVSSTYYFPRLPEWVGAFNARRLSEKHPVDGPYGNELLEAFAEQAIGAMRLGRQDGPDLLALSFSCNDLVGHRVGPDSPEVRDISIRTDQVLDKLFRFLDANVGLDKVLVVLTADHGVAPVPEVNQKRKMPGGRLSESAVLNRVQAVLAARFGEGKWILGNVGPEPYLNHDLIRQKKLELEDVEEAAAEAVRSLPHIFRVYTNQRMLEGAIPRDAVDRRLLNGYHQRRAADLFIVADPYWIFDIAGTTHGTPFNYDAHVPVIFMGPRIKPGFYHQTIVPNDIAPTLATMLEIETPSGSTGRVLHEMLTQ